MGPVFTTLARLLLGRCEAMASFYHPRPLISWPFRQILKSPQLRLSSKLVRSKILKNNYTHGSVEGNQQEISQKTVGKQSENSKKTVGKQSENSQKSVGKQ